jgi:hypothetical protein
MAYGMPDGERTYTRRCETCDLNWPNSWEFRTCFNCGKDIVSAHGTPMSEGEAQSVRKHVAFERYYAEREHAAMAAAVDE